MQVRHDGKPQAKGTMTSPTRQHHMLRMLVRQNLLPRKTRLLATLSSHDQGARESFRLRLCLHLLLRVHVIQQRGCGQHAFSEGPCLPCHAMSCHAMSCHAMPCDAMPCHACLQNQEDGCPVPEVDLKHLLIRPPVHLRIICLYST